ncbi:MAG: fumarylacetoacetate hydrolase family protein [Actinomycetaceae bacterium]|nr:fumarylacetoacetate hydrolase family protein [Actinomycetaceae bacterium]
MKIARLGLDQGPRYAVLDDEAGEFVLLADDPMFGSVTLTGTRMDAEQVRLVSPMIPRSKVIGFGGTYGRPTSLGELMVFLKPNTAVIGPDEPIILPGFTDSVEHEVEIAVVIGRVAKNAPVERAHEAIFGYTVANDVTADSANIAMAKGFDTACPIGPFIVTDLDPAGLALSSRVDRQPRRSGNTSDLAFSIPELVAYASSIFTLLPGDVILTGSPAGPGQIAPGQTVEVECEGIGVLRNPVLRR